MRLSTSSLMHVRIMTHAVQLAMRMPVYLKAPTPISRLSAMKFELLIIVILYSAYRYTQRGSFVRAVFEVLTHGCGITNDIGASLVLEVAGWLVD
jgi:hypothetical protein